MKRRHIAGIYLLSAPVLIFTFQSILIGYFVLIMSLFLGIIMLMD